jgi:type VI secretion system protein ImpH
MESQKREPGTTLKDRLFEEPYRFSFYKAVSLLESLFPDKKQVGRALDPSEEVVRFSVKPSLIFPPSDICRMTGTDGAEPVGMDCTFMGLIGPAGVLPHWYNELAIERVREKDYAFAAFLDIFHHRLLSLFYCAWKRYRVPENYLPGGRDRISRYLLSLVGLGTPHLSDRIGSPEESLVFYGGLLSRSVPSVAAIEATMEFFSGAEAAVEQFIDRFVPLDPEDWTRLGAANSRLGVDAVCGSSVLEIETKFRIDLGPMGYREFVRLLPSGNMLRSAFSLVRYMAGMGYEFDIRLILKREEVPLCVIGGSAPDSPRLGWATWLTKPGSLLQEDPFLTLQISDA